jgi:PKD repeat protein
VPQTWVHSNLFPVLERGRGQGANLAHVASFTFAVGANNVVSLTDTSTDSDGTIVQRLWNFGDGSSGGANNPNHTYTANGTYTVTLTVVDDLNGVDVSDPVVITVDGLLTGSLAITSPANSEVVRGSVAIAVNATSDIIRVKIYVNGVNTNLKDSSQPFSINWNSTSVPDGNYMLEDKGNDESDEIITWSAAVNVVVMNTIPPTPVETWRAANFTAAELADNSMEASLWGSSADPDGDDLNNDAEFALGTDPLSGNSTSDVITMSLSEEPGGHLLYMTYRRRNDDPDLICVAQLNRNLASWSAANLEILSVIDGGNGYELVTARELPDPLQSGRAFVRISIVRAVP